MAIRKRESKKAKNGYVYETYFYYRDKSNLRQRYAKSGFKTKKEAEEHEVIIRRELEEYRTIYKPCTMTLNEVIDEFIEVSEGEYQPNTLYHTKIDQKYFKDTLGKMLITNIDYKTLQAFFNERKDEGIETNKNIKKTLSRAFKYGVKADYIKNNPIQYVKVKGVNRYKEKKILSYNDFTTLLSLLEEKHQFRYDAYVVAIKIGYYTGLRVSEVLALSKDDFDFAEGLISINKKLVFKGLKKTEYYASSEMKSNKSKAIIPLPNILKEDLIKWFLNNPFDAIICDEEGNYINPTCLSNEVKKIAKINNIHFNFHMLRHTYATNLVRSEVDIKTAQELMRHTNFNTTLSIYTHVDSEHKKDVVNRVFH